jgi:hypothetical protein
LTGSETYPVDTNKSQGITPETMSLSGFTMPCIGYGPEQSAGTVAAGTIVLDASTGSFFNVTIATTGLVLQLLNPSPGQRVLVEVTQDGTGSRTITSYQTKIGAAATVAMRFAGGSAPVLSTATGAVDMLEFRFGGSAKSTPAYAVGASVALNIS